MVKIIDGDYLWAYHTDTISESHRSPSSRDNSILALHLKELTLGRSIVDRSGLLTKACDALGCQVKIMGGVGPKAKAFVDGEVDLFIYDPPGIRFWDAYPVVPLLEAHNALIYNWSGDTPLYTGASKVYGGFVATKPYVEKEKVLAQLHAIRS